MIWQIQIEDAALNRLTGNQLVEIIEKECEELERLIKTQARSARKAMGKDDWPDASEG